MKYLILAAALVAAGTTGAVAQYSKPSKPVDKKIIVIAPPPPVPSYSRSTHRYEERHHHSCHEKAHRLHQYERHASADGYISPREHDIIRSLKRDLRRTCGGHRWG